MSKPRHTWRALEVTITRIGTNKKYAEGWDKAFGGKRASGTKTQKPAAAKKASPKKSGKKVKR